MARKTAWTLKFDDFILLSSLIYYLNIIALLAICDKFVFWAFVFQEPPEWSAAERCGAVGMDCAILIQDQPD